jgi:ankyrin repeat protein
VALLLTSNANANAKSCDGHTPLHVAAKGGHKDVVEQLLHHKADVNPKDNKGHTPLHLAVSKNRKNIWMHPYCEVWEDHKAAVTLLVSNKADVNAKDNDGYTPLHLAAEQGCIDLVELLLANKADVNARNNHGLTPLDWAVASGQMAESVLASKANDDLRDLWIHPEGRSRVPAANSALSEGHRAVAKLLLAELQRLRTSNGEEIQAFLECPPFTGRAVCSDDECPCNETAMPPAKGYLYIAPSVIDSRRDCLTLKELQDKIKRMEHRLDAMIVPAKNVFAPTVLCEQGARLRNLDLAVAASDYDMWTRTGRVPFRATPKSDESVRSRPSRRVWPR